MRNRFQKQRKIDNKIRIFLPVMICGIMVAVLWNSSSQIFRETKKRQEESLKEASDQRGGTMLQCRRAISRKSFLYGETLWIGV